MLNWFIIIYLLNALCDIYGCIVGIRVMSAEPATLLINFKINKYDSYELLWSTARTKRNSGVTIRIGFDIDWEGTLSI